MEPIWNIFIPLHLLQSTYDYFMFVEYVQVVNVGESGSRQNTLQGPVYSSMNI